MSTTRAQTSRIAAKLMDRMRDLHVGSFERMKDSIVEGSSLTGAPGQPVQTSNLKGSWVPNHRGRFESALETNVEYAPAIENGGPSLTVASSRSGGMSSAGYRLRSKVGGFHSVKLTRINFRRIVEDVMREVAG